MPGYAPLGEYQQGFLDRKLKGGYRQQYRFDLSDADLEREMKGYALYHQVTGGTHLDTFIETILENNGAMVSTVEKIRIRPQCYEEVFERTRLRLGNWRRTCSRR